METKRDDYENALKKLSDILCVSQDLLEEYSKDISLLEYKKGEPIYSGTLQDENIFLLVEGNVLYKIVNSSGNVYMIIKKRNNLFPMRKLFQNEMINDSCVALTRVKLLSVSKTLLEELCYENKNTFLAIFNETLKEEQEILERNMALLEGKAERKVINTLRILARTLGEDEGNKHVIKKIMTVKLLSEMSGVSREMTSRVVNDLSHKRTLTKNRRTWKVSKSL